MRYNLTKIKIVYRKDYFFNLVIGELMVKFPRKEDFYIYIKNAMCNRFQSANIIISEGYEPAVFVEVVETTNANYDFVISDYVDENAKMAAAYSEGSELVWFTLFMIEAMLVE